MLLVGSVRSLGGLLAHVKRQLMNELLRRLKQLGEHKVCATCEESAQNGDPNRQICNRLPDTILSIHSRLSPIWKPCVDAAKSVFNETIGPVLSSL